MSEFAVKAANRGFTLRTGGANGADKAFESGCDLVGGSKEVYLPWAKFNKSESDLYNLSANAIKSVDFFHPYPANLNDAARRLMARNYHQVLGDKTTIDPVVFVICWTLGDLNTSGGTNQAIRIANYYGIPIFNLSKGDPSEMAKMICVNMLGSTW